MGKHQLVKGIFLPKEDTHFPKALESNPLYQGMGSYQLKKIEAALPLIPHKGIALDVGAHVGLWTRVLAASFERVYAYEPCFYDLLSINVGSCSNVIVRPFALGSMNGIVGFHKVLENSGNSRIAPTMDMAVTMHRLDDISKDAHTPARADFIKIDVEGYEYAVIQGAERFIQAHKPVMVVEQKKGNSERYGFKTGAAIELLQSWGAKVQWEMSGDFCLTW